jgi:hypothetical protein
VLWTAHRGEDHTPSHFGLEGAEGVQMQASGFSESSCSADVSGFDQPSPALQRKRRVFCQYGGIVTFGEAMQIGRSPCCPSTLWLRPIALVRLSLLLNTCATQIALAPPS